MEAAKAGQSVYITDLHSLFGSLADEASERLACVVELLDGTGSRRFDMRVPRLDGMGAAERDFVESYIHAEIYNILSALGGKLMTVYFDPARASLAEAVRRLPSVFGLGMRRSSRCGYGRAVNVIERMIERDDSLRRGIFLPIRRFRAGAAGASASKSAGGRRQLFQESDGAPLEQGAPWR